MHWQYILYFFITVIVVRLVINLSKYIRTQQLYRKYQRYLGIQDFHFLQYKQEIKSLFQEAGLEDCSVFHQEFMGYGNFANMRISVFDNLSNCRVDIVGLVQQRFNEAIGVYRKRWTESFNPIFWLNFIVKLPEYFMSFFGVLPEKVGVKVLLVIYWLIALIFGLKRFEILFLNSTLDRI